MRETMTSETMLGRNRTRRTRKGNRSRRRRARSKRTLNLSLSLNPRARRRRRPSLKKSHNVNSNDQHIIKPIITSNTYHHIKHLFINKYIF